MHPVSCLEGDATILASLENFMKFRLTLHTFFILWVSFWLCLGVSSFFFWWGGTKFGQVLEVVTVWGGPFAFMWLVPALLGGPGGGGGGGGSFDEDDYPRRNIQGINPGSGLPMCGSTDIAGNAYGTGSSIGSDHSSY